MQHTILYAVQLIHYSSHFKYDFCCAACDQTNMAVAFKEYKSKSKSK